MGKSFLDKVREWFGNIIHHDHEHYATVTVLKGDSLWAIAEDITGHGNEWHKIAKLNPGLDKNYTLQIGQELNIPLDWVTEPKEKEPKEKGPKE